MKRPDTVQRVYFIVIIVGIGLLATIAAAFVALMLILPPLVSD